MRAILVSVVGVLIPAGYVISLYAATEAWRVFDNDYRPFFWAIPAVVGAVGVALVGVRRPAILSLLVLLVPLFLVSRQQIINKRLRDCIASCANHSSFWGPWDFDGIAPLPDSTEFADFLVTLHKDGRDPLRGRCCPGAKRVGSQTGVVYVGGGLRLASFRGEDVLVAFCSWQSHPIPFDHQHCLVWEWGEVNGTYRGMFRRYCSDTGEMIGRIKRAIEMADRGVVPYSRAACQLLQDELQERKGFMSFDRDAAEFPEPLAPRMLIELNFPPSIRTTEPAAGKTLGLEC